MNRAPSPSISVVIPVHNGGSVFEKCLAAVRRSTFGDYELIVVDDGSTDDSAHVAARHGARILSLQVKHGPACARNRGVEIAGGEIVLFVDADVAVHADTLEKVVRYFEAHPSVDAIIGSYDDRPEDQDFLSQYKNLFHHYIHQHARSQASTFWAGCGAIRRSVFLEHGGFDETYRRPSIEDIELGFRLRARGATIHLVKDIQVTHLKRWTFMGLLRTDFFDRAIPWSLLMLRDRCFPPDLNVRASHQLSVILLYAMLAVSTLATLRVVPPAWLDPALAGALIGVFGIALIVLNGKLYIFFARKRNWPFALRALPMHWLYYLYCGAAVTVALTLHLWNGREAVSYKHG